MNDQPYKTVTLKTEEIENAAWAMFMAFMFPDDLVRRQAAVQAMHVLREQAAASTDWVDPKPAASP